MQNSLKSKVLKPKEVALDSLKELLEKISLTNGFDLSDTLGVKVRFFESYRPYHLLL